MSFWTFILFARALLLLLPCEKGISSRFYYIFGFTILCSDHRQNVDIKWISKSVPRRFPCNIYICIWNDARSPLVSHSHNKCTSQTWIFNSIWMHCLDNHCFRIVLVYFFSLLLLFVILKSSAFWFVESPNYIFPWFQFSNENAILLLRPNDNQRILSLIFKYAFHNVEIVIWLQAWYAEASNKLT